MSRENRYRIISFGARGGINVGAEFTHKRIINFWFRTNIYRLNQYGWNKLVEYYFLGENCLDCKFLAIWEDEERGGV